MDIRSVAILAAIAAFGVCWSTLSGVLLHHRNLAAELVRAAWAALTAALGANEAERAYVLLDQHHVDLCPAIDVQALLRVRRAYSLGFFYASGMLCVAEVLVEGLVRAGKLVSQATDIEWWLAGGSLTMTAVGAAVMIITASQFDAVGGYKDLTRWKDFGRLL